MKHFVINRILQQNRDIYNYIADDFSNTRKYVWNSLKNVTNYIDPGGQILDLGCGNGRLAETFINLKVKYLGLDNSSKLIEIAQQKFKDNKNFKFQLGDIIDLHLPNDQFNLVLLIAVLHHLPTKKLRQKVLQDVHQTLKPNGYLIITNWNLWSNMMNGKIRRRLFCLSDKWSRGVWRLNDAYVPWKTKSKKQYRYIHSFTKGELKGLLKKAGFVVEKIYYESGGQKKGIFVGGNLLAVARKK